MSQNSFIYFGDISIGSGLRVGILRMNNNIVSNVLKDFHKNFKNVKKAHLLDGSRILSILNFFDARRLLMASTEMSERDLNYYRGIYGKNSFFDERICGIQYFRLLKTMTYPNCKYRIVLCNDTCIGNPQKIIECCRRLAKANKYDFDISTGHKKVDESLKLVDYVAAALKKINKVNLSTIKNFNILDPSIDGLHLKKAFNVRK